MKKNKHDHKGTKALKLSIFFTLMLAPFLAVLFKCAYVTFNKNAKDSYSSQIVETTQTFNSVDQLQNGLSINVSWNGSNGSTNSYIYGFSNVSIDVNQYANTTDIPYNSVNFLGDSRIQFRVFDFTNNTSTNLTTLRAENLPTIITFISNSNFYRGGGNVTTSDAFTFKYTTFTSNKLDNAFYYAIDEAMESPYFAWARTSALYTATSGLTNGMGITTQAIPTLIVYWLILTAIYIIIDIVIESFTYLTHCIMNRFE